MVPVKSKLITIIFFGFNYIYYLYLVTTSEELEQTPRVNGC